MVWFGWYFRASLLSFLWAQRLKAIKIRSHNCFFVKHSVSIFEKFQWYGLLENGWICKSERNIDRIRQGGNILNIACWCWRFWQKIIEVRGAFVSSLCIPDVLLSSQQNISLQRTSLAIFLVSITLYLCTLFYTIYFYFRWLPPCLVSPHLTRIRPTRIRPFQRGCRSQYAFLSKILPHYPVYWTNIMWRFPVLSFRKTLLYVWI